MCVTTETRHLDRHGQLSEFEQDNNTDSEQESNTDSHSARNKAHNRRRVSVCVQSKTASGMRIRKRARLLSARAAPQLHSSAVEPSSTSQRRRHAALAGMVCASSWLHALDVSESKRVRVYVYSSPSVSLTTKGYDHKTPVRTPFDQVRVRVCLSAQAQGTHKGVRVQAASSSTGKAPKPSTFAACPAPTARNSRNLKIPACSDASWKLATDRASNSTTICSRNSAATPRALHSAAT